VATITANHIGSTAVLPYKDAPSRATLAVLASKSKTLKMWNGSVVAGQDGNTYDFTMLGNSPTSGTPKATLKTMIIPVVVTFTNTGDVYDPTTPNTACGQTQSAEAGLLNGPDFAKAQYSPGGTNVGLTQYTDAQMREEFWNKAGFNPKYHVLLKGKVPTAVDVTATGYPEYLPGTCNELGEIDINAWDGLLQGTLIPELKSFGVKSTTFPIFEVSNVVFYEGSSCCILGYHSAFNDPNPQIYSTSDWDTSNDFTNASDNAVASHEIAEATNDPFGTNATPAWGNTGQVVGCQNNLEVGDPLTGTVFTENIGGVNYTLQELAYFGWFYDDNIGVNGWYSTQHTFTTGAALCT